MFSGKQPGDISTDNLESRTYDNYAFPDFNRFATDVNASTNYFPASNYYNFIRNERPQYIFKWSEPFG